jgi:quinolinate synthase
MTTSISEKIQALKEKLGQELCILAHHYQRKMDYLPVPDLSNSNTH